MFALSTRNFVAKGFTLIELTIGMLVLSIALMVMTGALFPQAARSVDPWFQVRSAELAHSMMNEILAKRFDENSLVIDDMRCNEATNLVQAGNCISVNNLNDCSVLTGFLFREEANRVDFDDVDDFNCLTLSGDQLTDLTGKQELEEVYANFTIAVSVRYIVPGEVKLVTVTVSTPAPVSQRIVYSAYKANY